MMKRKGMSPAGDGDITTPGRKSHDAGYLTSDDWKCTDSPSGAHFWVETRKDYAQGLFECRYCAKERYFSTSSGGKR